MKSLVRALAVAICLLASSNVSYAGSITFNFTCSILIPGTNPDSCGAPTGSYGSITLTDNANGRVDLSWNLTPGFGATLERILLNTSTNTSATHEFFLVDISAGDVKTPTVGTALYCDSCQTLGDFGFDIRLSPNDNDFIGTASLGYWDKSPSVSEDITIAFLTASTPGSVVHPGTPNLYAGYRTNVLGGGVGEFWAGSTGLDATTLSTVPEPASLMLLGTGLIGFAARARSVRRRK